MTDKEFQKNIELIKEKDKAGLQTIYTEYISLIYHTILNIVHNKEDAEDITSEFFIKLAYVCDKYKPGSGHVTWLITIARNLTIDFIRKNKREIPTEEIYEEKPNLSYLEKTPEHTVLTKESFKNLLDSLRPSEREIIILKVACELTFKEISSILNEPMGTVTWRYQNAINKLRRLQHESE